MGKGGILTLITTENAWMALLLFFEFRLFLVLLLLLLLRFVVETIVTSSLIHAVVKVKLCH